MKIIIKVIIATIIFITIIALVFGSFVVFFALDRTVTRTPFDRPSSKWSGGDYNLYVFSNGIYGVLEYIGTEERQIYYVVLSPGSAMVVFDTSLDIGVDIKADPYFGRRGTDENGISVIGLESKIIDDAAMAVYSFNYRGKKNIVAQNSSPNEVFPETICFKLVDTDISEECIPY